MKLKRQSAAVCCAVLQGSAFVVSLCVEVENFLIFSLLAGGAAGGVSCVPSLLTLHQFA